MTAIEVESGIVGSDLRTMTRYGGICLTLVDPGNNALISADSSMDGER
jgi:hypothetical protein